MGSCYSCKSGGGAPTYTTTMDNKKKSEENSGVKQITPYSRSSSNSFGFKRRLPTTLKSLSQERTSELVQNYESKIATINNSSNQSVLKAENNITNKLNATNRNLHSNIPRFNSKNSTAGSSSIENLASSNLSISALDPNCNTLIEGITQEISNSLTVGNKKMGSKYSPGSNKTLHSRRITPRESENQTEKIQNGHKSDGKETAAAKGCLGKAGLSPKQDKSGLRITSKGMTQGSGLPKLQVSHSQKKGSLANKDTTKNKNTILSFTNSKAPLAKFDDMDAMHLSSETLTEEENSTPDFDSGIGGSVGEKSKKHDDDNETLAEVSELAKDNYDVSHGRDEIADKTICSQNGFSKLKKINMQKSVSSASYKTDKIQTNSNISRPQGLPLPPKHIPCLQTRIGSPTDEKKRQLKKKDEDYQKKISQKQISTKVNSSETKEQHINRKIKHNDRISSASNYEEAVVAKCEKEMVYKAKEMTSPKSSCEIKIDELKMSSSKSEEMTTSIESSTSQQDSFQDGGLCSPPSERETFLIDDEIADQPELIACQPQEMHGIFHSTQDSFCLDHEQFLGDDGNAGQDLYRGGSMETSSTSSISSDDLMLDYEDGMLGSISKNIPNWTRAHHSRSCSSSEAHAHPISSAESHKLLCSPKPMTAFEIEDDSIKTDSSYQISIQDVASMKTSLLKLERILKEAETLNPFDNAHSWKNGLLHNLAHNDPPHDCLSDESNSHSSSEGKLKELTQENVDLRRQIIYLQQELEEKRKTIRSLQEQMVKYVPEALVSSEKDVCNAATQTEKARLSLTALSQSYEDSISGTTVSTNGTNPMEGIFDHPAKGKRRLAQTSLNVTQSLNSLASNLNNKDGVCYLEEGTFPPERSASAVELCPCTIANTQAKSATSVATTHKHSKSLDDGTGGVTRKKYSDTSSQLSRSKIAVRLSNKGTLPQQPKMGTGMKNPKTTVTNRPSSKNLTIKK